jgi:alpha-glucoside transport system substrate-binding protein
MPEIRTSASARRAPWWTSIVTLGVVLVVASCAPEAPRPSTRSVRVLAAWGGAELAAFRSVLAPFEERTGIRVDYRATRDLTGTLAGQLDAGRPPDLAGLAGPNHMAVLARAGALRDLASAIDLRSYKSAVAPTFIDLGTVDGRLVGVFVRSAAKGLIWFDPRLHQHEPPSTWSELELTAVQMGDTKPWCLGLASQESSGWPGTDWIESFLLHQSGSDAYDAWVAGGLSWTSPEMTRAWHAYGRVVADHAVYGGAEAVLETDFRDAGDPLFTRPPGCLFLHQGSFMPAFWRDEGLRAGSDYDFFPFPEISADHRGVVTGAGDLFGLVSDDPAAEELLEYLVSPEAQTIWVSSGGALSVHRNVTDYPDAVAAKAAGMLTGADHFRFDASDLMPGQLNAAFWQGVLDYSDDPSRLPGILADLEAVRLRAYGSA